MAPAPAPWKIVFPAEQGGDWSFFVVGRSRGQPVRVGSADAPIWFPQVTSPDGLRMIVPRARQSAIVVQTLATGERKRVATGRYTTAGWSPDSGWIAFEGVNGGVWVVRDDGSHLHRLTDDSSVTVVRWSPDGKSIAYSSDSGLVVVGADGAGRRVVSRSEGAQDM